MLWGLFTGEPTDVVGLVGFRASGHKGASVDQAKFHQRNTYKV